jgi:hypothetical protein
MGSPYFFHEAMTSHNPNLALRPWAIGQFSQLPSSELNLRGKKKLENSSPKLAKLYLALREGSSEVYRKLGFRCGVGRGSNPYVRQGCDLRAGQAKSMLAVYDCRIGRIFNLRTTCREAGT